MRRESRTGPSDRARFEHILRAGAAIASFVRDRRRDDLETDDMLRRALVNAVQEIGEAATRITDEGRSRAASLPWGQIVAMRHVLVHVYWGVDNDQLWNTATIEVPAMIPLIQSAIAAWESR
jgi:uncharacterized protein with HEPN domain